MKPIMAVVSLILAVFSYQAGAASVTMFNFNLGTVADTTHFGHTLNGIKNNPIDSGKDFLAVGSSFKDTYVFSVPANRGIRVDSITSSIASLTGTLNGHALTKTQIGPNFWSLTYDLLTSFGPGSHTLVLTGNSRGSYGGDITVTQTPIPAAVWLFGSALMGIAGLRRKQA